MYKHLHRQVLVGNELWGCWRLYERQLVVQVHAGWWPPHLQVRWLHEGRRGEVSVLAQFLLT